MPEKILLPVDLSEETSWKKPLSVALEQIRAHGGELHVITVMPRYGVSMVGSYFPKDFEQKALHDLGEALTNWVADNVPDDIDVHPHVMHGSVYDEILRAADRLEVDLIVMGAHRPELRDYLLGPNAARVVRHANQSVYVVRG